MHVLDHDLTKVPADRLEDIQRAAAKILTVQEALGNVAYGLTQGYNKTLK
jgi:ribosomal protein L6P/L9E